MSELYPGQRFVHSHSKNVRETENRWVKKQGRSLGDPMKQMRIVLVALVLLCSALVIGVMYQRETIDSQKALIKVLWADNGRCH